MEIGVVGAGYVGLTTAACFAEVGHNVICADNDPRKIATLRSGRTPFYEPHLEEIVLKNLAAGRLQTTSRTDEAIDRSTAVFICVGTPPLENGDVDFTGIEAVARDIALHARGYRLIVEKSTVPVQTGRQIERHLAHYKRHADFRYDVVSNPEFLREGSSVEDFLHPARIVLGAENPKAAQILADIYAPIIEQTFSCPLHAHETQRARVPVVLTDLNAAELIKHAANSFLAMKISYTNMVSDLCEAVGCEVDKVAEGMALDPRIGPHFLKAGVGFGGFCFPKDLQAFIHIGEKHQCDFSLLREVEKINLRRVDRLLKKVRDELWILRGKKICVWGMAFKPNTDDIRFAPALAIIRKLCAEGAEVQVYDPRAMENAKREIQEVTYCGNPYEAAEGAEAILILTEWDEFRDVDFRRLRDLVSRPLLVDGRNMFSAPDIARYGFRYLGIGRAAPPVHVGASEAGSPGV